MAFVDDMTLITRSREELRSVSTAVQREVLKMGLVVNENKTKIMVMGESVGSGSVSKIELRDWGTVRV